MALLVLFGYQYLSSNNEERWQAPTKAPTDGNVPAPVHIGTNTQTKHGGLGAAIFKADLQVNSPKYCDKNGENCRDASDGNYGGGGGGALTRTELITPNYTRGYVSYTGPKDVSKYQFLEVGVFDNFSDYRWGQADLSSQSTLVPVLANTKAALNCSSNEKDCMVLVEINASKQVSFWFPYGDNGLPRLAFVNGLGYGLSELTPVVPKAKEPNGRRSGRVCTNPEGDGGYSPPTNTCRGRVLSSSEDVHSVRCNDGFIETWRRSTTNCRWYRVSRHSLDSEHLEDPWLQIGEEPYGSPGGGSGGN